MIRYNHAHQIIAITDAFGHTLCTTLDRVIQVATEPNDIILDTLIVYIDVEGRDTRVKMTLSANDHDDLMGILLYPDVAYHGQDGAST